MPEDSPIPVNTVIETERLRLLPVDERWVADIFREFTPEITRYMSTAPTGNISDTFAFLHASQQSLAAGTDFVAAILSRQNGEYLGNCGVHSLHTELPSIGLWIKASAQRQGYGHEAIGGLLGWVRANYDFSQVEYVVDRDNPGSRRIVESFGGVLVGQHFKQRPNDLPLDFLEYLIPLR